MKEEIISLNEEVEEGKRVEESMKKQCQKLEVEVNILKGKLEEKDKHLRFQDSTKVLDNIISSQRSLSIKFGLGFHETVKGESSSRDNAKYSKDINAKPEVFKEKTGQPKIMNFQRKSFSPNYRSINRFSPLINNVECFVCHNYGHVATNCKVNCFDRRQIDTT